MPAHAGFQEIPGLPGQDEFPVVLSGLVAPVRVKPPGGPAVNFSQQSRCFHVHGSEAVRAGSPGPGLQGEFPQILDQKQTLLLVCPEKLRTVPAHLPEMPPDLLVSPVFRRVRPVNQDRAPAQVPPDPRKSPVRTIPGHGFPVLLESSMGGGPPFLNKFHQFRARIGILAAAGCHNLQACPGRSSGTRAAPAVSTSATAPSARTLSITVTPALTRAPGHKTEFLTTAPSSKTTP